MNNIFEFHRELNIKKVISVFILAVFIIILIVVFHLQNKEKKLKEEEISNPYKTYISADNKVSLELPKRYNLQEIKSNYLLQLQASDGLLINIEEKSILFGKSLNEVVNSDKNVYTQKFENAFDVSDLEEFNLENSNTLSSYTYNFKYISNATLYNIHVFWIQGNSCYYIISISFPEESTSKYQGLESEIISSFSMY